MNGIVIKTERLILKPLGTADLETANSYSLDEQNTRFMCFLPNRDSEETLQFLKTWNQNGRKSTPDSMSLLCIIVKRISVLSAFTLMTASESWDGSSTAVTGETASLMKPQKR